MNKNASTDKATLTPGPWKYVKPEEKLPYYVYSGDNRHDNEIAVLYAKDGEADARLCAAAPDLLAALTLLHDNLAEYQRINNIGGYDNHDMKMARAAIAKAKGE